MTAIFFRCQDLHKFSTRRPQNFHTPRLAALAGPVNARCERSDSRRSGPESRRDLRCHTCRFTMLTLLRHMTFMRAPRIVALFIGVFGLLGLVAPVVSASGAMFLRLFLVDGTPIASYGEFARVSDHVVFSMPVGGTA